MKGIIAWWADNPVAANLLMALILAGGIVSLGTVGQEIFPEFASDRVTVSVPYPGATPEEVEQSICVRIEEEVQGVDGVKRVSSTATEGVGAVVVEVLEGHDVRQVLDDVKARVDAIDTFPVDAEEPVISEVTVRRQVMSVALSGPADERSLKNLGERIRDEIAALPDITQVELTNARPFEISVEVSEASLRRHGLRFDDVANAIRRSSLDLPGGSVRTDGGEILLRTQGQAYTGEEFERLVVLTRPDGTRLLVGDVATVIDGFAETDQATTFDANPSVLIQVFRVGDQAALDVADAVHEYVEVTRDTLPEGIQMTVWDDSSVYLRGRIALLLKNGRSGLILVFLVLALFLRFKLAFWVSLGIPVSFLGAIWLMPMLGVSINLISLFAFILVLGIVVDDAIVVGESIYTHFRRHGDARRAAVEGAQEVAVPVIFAVLTTVAAFLPLLNVPGSTGQIWRVIPLIVIPVLLFSMVESKLVLPAHLRHLKGDDTPSRMPGAGLWRRLQRGVAHGLERFIERRYQPFLDTVLRWRYLTVSIGLALLMLTAGLVAGGWVGFVFMPSVEADIVVATLTMPEGTPADATESAMQRLVGAAEELRVELDAQTPEGEESVFRHVLATVGGQPKSAERAAGPGGAAEGFSGAHLGEVQIELVPSEQRALSSAQIVGRWRELTGAIPDAVELSFAASLFNAGAAIDVQLASSDAEALQRVTDAVKAELSSYAGVLDVTDSYRAGKEEVELTIKPEGEAAGLTQADLGRQVRQAFYGEEAQRVQRGRDDVRVMVRYPESQRRSLGDLESMRIRTPDGAEVPLTSVAEVRLDRGYSTIQRVDRQRVIHVTADVDQSVTTANAVLAPLTEEFLPGLLRDHPSVRYSLEGEQKEQRESLQGLLRGFAIALMMIYALMAVPFKSYVHPVVIMSAIPFGLVGAIWGHLLMGKDLSILSVCGMVALAGVVVNDSLVLVDFINRRRREGMPMGEAVRTAGAARFRPILLTSMTTFAGLTPMLLERSLQAQFLIPMAISLAFGVLFATFVILLIVPSGYLILEDLLRLPQRLLARRRERSEASVRPRPGDAAPTP